MFFLFVAQLSFLCRCKFSEDTLVFKVLIWPYFEHKEDTIHQIYCFAFFKMVFIVILCHTSAIFARFI